MKPHKPLDLDYHVWPPDNEVAVSGHHYIGHQTTLKIRKALWKPSDQLWIVYGKGYIAKLSPTDLGLSNWVYIEPASDSDELEI